MKHTIKFISVILLFCGMLLIVHTSQAENDIWVRKADMPTSRSGLCVASVDGKIYAFGGWKNSLKVSDKPLTVVEEYDPRSDQWAKKKDIPVRSGDSSAYAMNGKIYLFGGVQDHFTGVNNVLVYDPKADTWIQKSAIPAGGYNLATCELNGKIYVIGMGNSWIYEYDPITDTWLKKTTMPDQKFGIGGCAINGKIYVFGGASFNAGNVVYYKNVDEYDPILDTWKRKNDMTSPGYTKACVINDKVYTVGRWKDANFPIVEEYNPVTETWTKRADMLVNIWSFGVCTVNNKIYLIGGDRAVQDPSNVVQEYTPKDWKPFSVSPQLKLTTTWGEIKQDSN